MPFFKRKKKEDFSSIPDLPPLPPVPGVPEVPALGDEPAPPPMRVSKMPRGIPKIRPAELLTPVISQEEMEPAKAKVFVRIDKYKDIMNTIDNMQHKINELQKTLNKISSIKTREAEIIAGWNALLSEAKNKVDEVSGKLIRPEA